ncbi:hypothetical protein [Sediminicola arcticus]|jgi:hypothetical protein|uniref:Uncharacterized protein n=1 Tax=Sediminicola arcticus TaxID=1574308 RepID=A0ABV2SXA9_9FLAO
MKTAFRVISTFISFISSYLFIYWVPFSLIPGAHTIAWIPNVVSLLLAMGIAFFIWKKTRAMSNNLALYIIMGGVITGAIGFILGFFGPIIFTPNSAQGPLLGIFITGPIGFLIGIVVGGIYWRVKVRNNPS